MHNESTEVQTVWIRLAVPFLLTLALIGANSSASAQWLDKLKGMLSGDDDKQQALSDDQIGGGLKEALRVGTETVVSSLGTTDGGTDKLITQP